MDTYVLSTMKCHSHVIRKEQKKKVELWRGRKGGMEEGLAEDGDFSLILETIGWGRLCFLS